MLIIFFSLGFCVDDRFDFVKPVTTLSIPTTNSVVERRSTRVDIPNPGFKITPSDNAMAIVKRKPNDRTFYLEIDYISYLMDWEDLILLDGI